MRKIIILLAVIALFVVSCKETNVENDFVDRGEKKIADFRVKSYSAGNIAVEWKKRKYGCRSI